MEPACAAASVGVGALAHAAAVFGLFFSFPSDAEGRWVGLDSLGRMFLATTAILFLSVVFYTLGYLRREEGRTTRDLEEGFLFRNEPEGMFVGCLFLFLASMSLVCIAQHLGLLWVAVEATTLASAPLISFHRHHRSLEATWKYLLICSVGIAFALLGVFMLAVAGEGLVRLLALHELIASAGGLNPVWLKAAFILMLVGYGTKARLAPMHTWLPDAHSEAPSMVSALLSGALLNCAFLAQLRAHAILLAAGLGMFSGGLLIVFGLISLVVAALFVVRQGDYKRLLAYSSIENMGILALGMGGGGLAVAGALLHALNHSLAKGLLFLVSGNLLAVFRSKRIADIQGALSLTPISGGLWLGGFFALGGLPPFGPFLSEWLVLKGLLENGRWVAAVFFLLALSVVFAGVMRHILPMAFGRPSMAEGHDGSSSSIREPLWSILSPLVLGAMALGLGLFVSAPLWRLIHRAAVGLGGP